MKRLLGLAAAVAVLIGTASVYADGGCCAGGKAKMSANGAACSDMYSKLKLTEEQKAKVATLKDDCLKATSTSERHAMMTKGMEKILTPEQFAQWKSTCDEGMKSGACPAMKSSGCPFMKNSGKS
jgi:Spy/CpxP family protein refolding chaperone